MNISLFSLPKTVIQEILSYTTAKSVTNFQLVSKACKTIGENGHMWKTFFLKDFGKPDLVDLEKFQKEHPNSRTDPLFHQVFYKNFLNYQKQFIQSIRGNKESYDTLVLGNEKGETVIYEQKGELFLFLGQKNGTIASYTITNLKKTLQDENLFKDGISGKAHQDPITCLLVFKNDLFSSTLNEIKQWEISSRTLKTTLFSETIGSLQANENYLIAGSCLNTFISIWKMGDLAQHSPRRWILALPEWQYFFSFLSYHLFKNFLFISDKNKGVLRYDLDDIEQPPIIIDQLLNILPFVSSKKHLFGVGWICVDTGCSIYDFTPSQPFHQLKALSPLPQASSSKISSNTLLIEAPSPCLFVADMSGDLHFIDPTSTHFKHTRQEPLCYKRNYSNSLRGKIAYLKFLKIDYTPYLFIHLSEGTHFLLSIF